MLPFASLLPIQTHSQLCHQLSPSATLEDDIIHVLMLKESEIQKFTKFIEPHRRRSGSTGFKSSLASMSCVCVRPGSLSTAILSRNLAALDLLVISMMDHDGGDMGEVADLCSRGVVSM